MHWQSIFKNKRKYDFLKSTTLRWSSLTNSSGSEWKGKYVKIWWERKSVEGECKRACPTGFDPLWFPAVFSFQFHLPLQLLIHIHLFSHQHILSNLVPRSTPFPIMPPLIWREWVASQPDGFCSTAIHGTVMATTWYPHSPHYRPCCCLSLLQDFTLLCAAVGSHTGKFHTTLRSKMLPTAHCHICKKKHHTRSRLQRGSHSAPCALCIV